MIRVAVTQKGVTLSDPKNLEPIVFKCKECGCTVRKLLETNSYVLMSLSKEIETGKKKLCRYCNQLNEFRGVCE